MNGIPDANRPGATISLFLSLIYFEILGLTMEDGEPVFHPQLPINCGHMRIRGFEVAGWLFDLDIDGKEVSVRKRKIS